MSAINRELDLFCRAYMRACSTLLIRPGQMALLEILCTTPGPHTPMMLADCMHVSRPMITVHLAALADLGCVSRVASPDDGRSICILPTKKGRKLYLEYVTANQCLLSDLSRKMGVKKFDAMIKLISLANKCLAE